MTDWHVYLVRTREGHLYTGIATDVERRLGEHRCEDGRGAKYLRGRGPLELVYRCELGDRGLALLAERRLKRRTKPAKEAIVASAPSRSTLLRLLRLPDRSPRTRPPTPPGPG